MKIKIITATSSYYAEQEINLFLEQNPNYKLFSLMHNDREELIATLVTTD